MTLSFLESFDVTAAAETPRMVPETALAVARQEGRDEGYRAGWAAATAAADRDQERIGAEIAASVKELGFTYQEARAHVMRGIEPLLRELLGSFMPAMMTEALGGTLLQELVALAEDGADLPVRIAVAPQEAKPLRALLSTDAPVPLKIVEEAALSEGQATLRLGQSERLVDLSGVLCRITDAFGAVTDLNQRTLAHA